MAPSRPAWAEPLSRGGIRGGGGVCPPTPAGRWRARDAGSPTARCPPTPAGRWRARDAGSRNRVHRPGCYEGRCAGCEPGPSNTGTPRPRRRGLARPRCGHGVDGVRQDRPSFARSPLPTDCEPCCPDRPTLTCGPGRRLASLAVLRWPVLVQLVEGRKRQAVGPRWRRRRMCPPWRSLMATRGLRLTGVPRGRAGAVRRGGIRGLWRFSSNKYRLPWGGEYPNLGAFNASAAARGMVGAAVGAADGNLGGRWRLETTVGSAPTTSGRSGDAGGGCRPDSGGGGAETRGGFLRVRARGVFVVL